MLSSDICKTLLAVEEVELSFERTLRNINNIQHRYNMVSSMKRKAMRAKESFEAEIQAAITEPTPTKVTTKVTNPPRKSLKKKKILPLVSSKRVKRVKKEKLNTVQESLEKEPKADIVEPSLTELKNAPKKSLKKKVQNDKTTKRTNHLSEIPLPVLEPIPYEEYVPETICIRARTYEIHSTETQIVARKPYTDLIRRLYRAARWKTQQEARDQQDLEQSPDCFMCSCSCSSC